jgi:ribulose-phosphate 3-epimerase
VSSRLKLHLGLKTDPIEYRYSYEWLFRVMADEGVKYAQVGSFFELYRLPDSWFVDLRKQAKRHGVTIASTFTAHRELGGWFRNDVRWEAVARRSVARAIEAGALMGACSVGHNPGAVLRDQMATKAQGITCWVKNMKGLMRHAKKHGLACIGVEPMSCLAEPPTLPEEIRDMMEPLLAYHRANPKTTSTVGCCTDVSHGYADEAGNVVYDNMQLLDAALPYTTEVHLKNTDSIFNSTFGFTQAERARGIVDIAGVRDFLLQRAERLPVRELIGYLEIGGPKTGRDYSDGKLEAQLRESLRWCKKEFEVL